MMLVLLKWIELLCLQGGYSPPSHGRSGLFVRRGTNENENESVVSWERNVRAPSGPLGVYTPAGQTCAYSITHAHAASGASSRENHRRGVYTTHPNYCFHQVGWPFCSSAARVSQARAARGTNSLRRCTGRYETKDAENKAAVCGELDDAQEVADYYLAEG